MTAKTVAIESTTTRRQGGTFLGFGTAFRKEMTEWVRSRRALIVGAVSIPFALLSTIVPFLVPKDSPGAATLSLDPTTNVLMGWAGLTFQIVALLATMSLVSAERDRGTLGWSLTNPVSPTSILAAKWSAAMLVYGGVGVVLPIALSTGLAAVVYGHAPDLAAVGLFTALYLMVPAFNIGLMVALGTGLKGTAGIAGIGFLVMLLPSGIGALIPIVEELSPTSIVAWAISTSTGHPASSLTLIGWAVSMVVLVVGAKLIFDREEF